MRWKKKNNVCSLKIPLIPNFITKEQKKIRGKKMRKEKHNFLNYKKGGSHCFTIFPTLTPHRYNVKMLLLSLKMGGRDKKVSERDISITRGSAKKWNFIRLKNRWVYSDTADKKWFRLFCLFFFKGFFFRNDRSRKLFLVYPLVQ